MGKHLLELKNLQYSYGNIEVVHGINMYVDEGEIVTIIGANGAGKTTTLQTISGLTDKAGLKGEIIFDGERIDGAPGHKITKKGLVQVLEGRHVFSKLTVAENIQMGTYIRNDKEKISKDIEQVYELFPRLYERRTQLAGTLSGGEQQMLAIGRAMLSDPKMILLDEPSLGLAPIIITEIFEAIVDINKKGTSVLFVEQNSKIALNVASRGYVMQNGDITIEDICDNLLKNEDVKKAYLGE